MIPTGNAIFFGLSLIFYCYHLRAEKFESDYAFPMVLFSALFLVLGLAT